MAPLTAWLPARPNQDFDLVVKIVGPGAPMLLERVPVTQFLADQGFSVMAQSGRLNGDHGDCVLQLRLAARPFYSMGHGCDVLVYLGNDVPECGRVHLQPGSVLIWEPPPELRSHPVLPEGVIAYAVPLEDFGARCEEGVASKALAALGVLFYLLGIPKESLDRFTPSMAAPPAFGIGWDFARDRLKKRDAYSLPVPTVADRPHRIVLTPEQAIMVGFAVSACECGATCEEELVEAPAQWIAKHTGIAGAMVSVSKSGMCPDVQVYRGLQGRMMALLKGDDAAMTACLDGFKAPSASVAADIPDAVRLVIAGHERIRSRRSDGVAVMIERALAGSQQSVDLSAVRELLQWRETGVKTLPSDPGRTSAERGEDFVADVGYVAWGAAHGVVRDAVALCDGFGLNVSALYPRVVVPFPHDELESFARSVRHVVLVESSRAGGCEKRLREACSFPFTVLAPLPGQVLTPMDIFLREGLGAV